MFCWCKAPWRHATTRGRRARDETATASARGPGRGTERGRGNATARGRGTGTRRGAASEIGHESGHENATPTEKRDDNDGDPPRSRPGDRARTATMRTAAGRGTGAKPGMRGRGGGVAREAAGSPRVRSRNTSGSRGGRRSSGYETRSRSRSSGSRGGRRDVRRGGSRTACRGGSTPR